MLFEKIQLEPDETVVKTVRKHWFVITLELLLIIFMGLMPVFVFMGLLMMTPSEAVMGFFETQTPIIIFGLASWLLLSAMATATAWTHYYLDLWVITDRRIIVIDQIGFFNRKVSNFRLERLQDIKVSVKGLIPTLLNYGTVRAQTASAAESNFESRFLPDPRGLQALIQTAMDTRLQTLGNNIPMAD
ncbi:PH domain-containing protein [Patescibacteria group bacterium]|nr:PH domain-containing protein [Patescibacteria group bacterium]